MTKITKGDKMFYKAELNFLCNALKKCHIQPLFLNPKDKVDERLELGLRLLLDTDVKKASTFYDIVSPIEKNTIYKMTDIFSATYIFFLLPNMTEQTLFVIGPYLTSIPSSEEMMEWSEKQGISPKEQKQLENYYNEIPLLPENNQLFALLDAFGEVIWGAADKFSIVDINKEITNVSALFSSNEADEKNTIWNMHMMEKRYAYENEIMQAIAAGRVHKMDMIISRASVFKFEQRLADPVRNGKNFCIIMNTLARKAAEQGGVHPIYLDSVSSTFAIEIEQLSSEGAIADLMYNMFRTYCTLVKKHSMKDFSSPVQKAIACIDSDISENLTTSQLAEMQNVSASYLSTLFKKETGKTITEYINGKRVENAKSLLRKTNLQVQTIAQHCGIMDMNYFSKVFKKYTGKTPKEYRESFRKT